MKTDKKVIRGWIFYDWANSVYNLVISSAIFPIFYSNVTKAQYLEQNPEIQWKEGMSVLLDFFGFQVDADSLIAYVLSASFLTISLLSPILSGIADYSGGKKKFLQFFCYLGALACISLYWFDAQYIELGMISIYLASIGFWSSFVFYNAYLPEIAPPDDHDKISARGFAMGYLGSMLLLMLCLAIIMGIDPKYTKFSFILVGLWWIGFAQITFFRLPKGKEKGKIDKSVIFKGFKELKQVFSKFTETVRLKRFLRSFFFFNTGVQTVMLMAVYFAKKAIVWNPIHAEMGTLATLENLISNSATNNPEFAETLLKIQEEIAENQDLVNQSNADAGLIIAILLIQLLGAGGAFLMSRISHKIGNLKTLRIVVLGWLLICAYAYFITRPYQFYILACSVGLVMGGVQALARSTYSKFLPKTDDTASFFSFYDVTEKIGIVLGTLFYGLMYQLTGNIRMSVVSIAIFFALGYLLLWLVPKKEVEGINNSYIDND